MTIHVEEDAFDIHEHSGILEALGLMAPSALVSLLHVSDDSIKLIDPDQNIIFANEIAARQHDLPVGKMEGVRWTDAWPDHLHTELVDAHAACLSGVIMRLRMIRPTRGGRDRDWALNLIPIFSSDSSVGAVLGVGRQILAEARDRLN